MKETADLSNTSIIFVELAGELRRQMLIRLNKEKLRLSELAKDMVLTYLAKAR